MKKIENNFVVTGFVGKDAEIRQFTNASVARFPLAVSLSLIHISSVRISRRTGQMAGDRKKKPDASELRGGTRADACCDKT